MKWTVSIWIAVAILVPAAQAELIVYDEDPSLFGDLDQHNTDCKRNGCGPTAAVNSFVFLQNQYPSIYGDMLVPSATSTPTQTEQADVANDLGKYMKTCCARGTYWGNFITGKQEYLDDAAPDTTVSSAQADYAWNAAIAGPKPGPDSGITLQTNTVPTIGFILGALQHKQDLEILITDSDGKNGHYLTVTGISWDTDDLTGFISYVDPRDGEDHTVDIASAVGEPLTIEYHDETRQIRVAVDESPVSAPEPGPASLILAGLAILGGRLLGQRRAHTRRTAWNTSSTTTAPPIATAKL